MNFRAILWIVIVSIAGCTNAAPENPPRRAAAANPEVAVRAAIAELLDVDANAIDLRKPLSEMGADDLDIVEIVMSIEERLNVMISDEALARIEGKRGGEAPVRVTGADLVTLARDARSGAKATR